MAVGACSCGARKLFAITVGLYLFGFTFMVGNWNKSTVTIGGSENTNLPERKLKFASIPTEYENFRLQQGLYNLPLSNTNSSLNIGVNSDGVDEGAEKHEIDTIASTMTKSRWEEIQKLRKSQLKHACQKLTNKPPLNGNITHIMANNKRQLWPFIVNDNYKLMYCYISKVGSTHWKMAFLVLQGKYKRVEDVPGSRAHDPSLRKLSSYPSTKEVSLRLNNYTIFIFVRNPFARVISGYRSKLLQPNPSYHRSVGKTIVKRYRENPSEEELKGHNVTFPEFVKYLTDPKTKNLDGHFKPMYQMVLPCSVRFDYIGKLETAEEDAKYILQNTHVDHLIHFKQTQRNVSHDQATFDKYFAEVPREDVKSLYELYYPDFELFGYELPEYMKSWVQ